MEGPPEGTEALAKVPEAGPRRSLPRSIGFARQALWCRAGTCLSPVALAKGGAPPAWGAPQVRALHTTAAPAVPPRRDRRGTPAEGDERQG